jgi:biotin transporter BioY
MGISQVLGIFGIFIIFDIIKIVIALFIIPFLRPIINKESSQ